MSLATSLQSISRSLSVSCKLAHHHRFGYRFTMGQCSSSSFPSTSNDPISDPPNTGTGTGTGTGTLLGAKRPSSTNLPFTRDEVTSSCDINVSAKDGVIHRYNEVKFPRRIILVRHGESLGNVDETAYSHIPDWKIPLTKRGEAQASELGRKIRELVGDDAPLSIFVSPYLRTQQTLEFMLKELPQAQNNNLSLREEPRLTEQQFGNFQHPNSMQKYKDDRGNFGRFYYRFPSGESGLDVYTRVSSFIGTIFREWSRDRMEETNVVIVTHGLTLRLFLMRWYHYTVEQFEETYNPENGCLVVMERKRWSDQQQAGVSGRGSPGNSGNGKAAVSYSFVLDEDSLRKLNLPSPGDARCSVTVSEIQGQDSEI